MKIIFLEGLSGVYKSTTLERLHTKSPNLLSEYILILNDGAFYRDTTKKLWNAYNIYKNGVIVNRENMWKSTSSTNLHELGGSIATLHYLAINGKSILKDRGLVDTAFKSVFNQELRMVDIESLQSQIFALKLLYPKGVQCLSVSLLNEGLVLNNLIRGKGDDLSLYKNSMKVYFDYQQRLRDIQIEVYGKENVIPVDLGYESAEQNINYLIERVIECV
jgi:hypothetical protein